MGLNLRRLARGHNSRAIYTEIAPCLVRGWQPPAGIARHLFIFPLPTGTCTSESAKYIPEDTRDREYMRCRMSWIVHDADIRKMIRRENRALNDIERFKGELKIVFDCDRSKNRRRHFLKSSTLKICDT